MLAFYSLILICNILIIAASKCQNCKKFVNLFEEELERTKKFNYGGGNSNWEEKSLPKYADSEIRFHEMIDNIHHQKNEKISLFIEDIEEKLEEWWFFKKAQYSNLHDWLCVMTLKECCKVNHWGPDCHPCHTQVGSVFPCTGNGECSGEGTRRGNGRCICRGNAFGPLCDKCDRGHFLTQLNETHVSCTRCDASCLNTCNGTGPDKCDACATNFLIDNGTCFDIDECQQASGQVCKEGEYCTNTYGSHKCSRCHASCDTCSGSARNCTACSRGYQMPQTQPSEQNGVDVCADVDECTKARGEGVTVCPDPDVPVCKNLPGSYECVTGPLDTPDIPRGTKEEDGTKPPPVRGGGEGKEEL